MAKNGVIRQFDDHLTLIQKLSDTCIITGTLILSVWLYPKSLTWNDKYTIVAICAVTLFYFAAKINGLYRSYRISKPLEEYRPLLISWLATLGGLLALGYSLKSTHELSRIVLGYWAALTPLALVLLRAVFRGFLASMRAKGRNTRSVLIVGVDESAQELARSINSMPQSGLVLKGFITQIEPEEIIEREGLSQPIVGDYKTLLEMARANEVDIVYIAISMHKVAIIDMLLEQLGDTTASIFLVPDYHLAEIAQGNWVTVGDVATVSVIDAPFIGIDSWLKRTEDIVLSSLALLVFSVPMLVIAIAVKLSSPGPVLFKQKRYGLNGNAINVWKFRSMTVMENGDDFVQATKNDARITPLGKFLRRTSLDEWPQLFNILMGDMSLVGPRPHAVAHNEEYRGKIRGYMQRHKVKPGMTGLAQVNGYRGETDTDEKMEKRVRYDVEYICNWSIWLDMEIILRTPIELYKGSNAY